MELTFKNCKKYEDQKFHTVSFADSIPTDSGVVVSFSNCLILPTFCDVHVHLREPGFFYKETILTGTRASARGGYSDVFSMPNLDPVPDTVENIRVQLDIIERDAVINVHPYASITMGEKGERLVDFESLKKYTRWFSDDGRGVQSLEMMEEAMQIAKKNDLMIVAHCEDNSLLRGGYIHDGEYSKAHGHKGICSESEWGPIKRDLELAERTGCKYHVCHISTKESVELIREAKKRGVDVTCETGPHYLTLDDSMLEEDGRFKMNPPLRSKEDREALIEGIIDGTIDMIATDHAPHSAEEKSRGLMGSMMGVVGIETAFPVLYTKLVKTGVVSLERLVELLSINPRKRFGLPATKDFTVWDMNEEFNVDPDEFLSKGRATPFKGERLFGRCKLTTCNGKVAYFNK
ncbi:MAG: dihydroorotase [Ruminococcaceae bacterium]|nr:dihydroorotase [Oscillospiraceae bacterium]